MSQEIIVYAIIFATLVVSIGLPLLKRFRKKNAAANQACETIGCNGCPLKEKCH